MELDLWNEIIGEMRKGIKMNILLMNAMKLSDIYFERAEGEMLFYYTDNKSFRIIESIARNLVKDIIYI